MNYQTSYRILVESYMTKYGTPKFDFMTKVNDNVPMPNRAMTGTVLQMSNAMVKMKLISADGKEWTGWVLKKAILKEVNLTEPIEETIEISIRNGKTFVPFGNQLAIRERIAFLMKQFGYKDIGTDGVYFNDVDFEDICKELKELQIPYVDKSNQYFNYYLVPEEQSLSVELPEISSMTKSTLYPYQKEGVLYGLQHKHFLLGDEMGLGKTLQAILIALGKKQQFGFKHCLIVCGVNSVKYNWVSEIKKHTEESGVVLADGNAEKLKQLNLLGRRIVPDAELATLSASERKKAIKANEINQAHFFIVNIEAFRNDAFATKIKELCQTGVIGGIVFDELHKCINVESKQSVGILKAKAHFKIGLTGTPLINKPIDSYFTFLWLEKTTKNYWQWANIFQRKVDQYTMETRNLELLQKNFERIMLRRKKAEVLDLPEKIYTEELIEMNVEQRRLYELLYDDELEGCPLNPAVKLLRFRQITEIPDYVAAIFGQPELASTVRSAKLERLAEHVEEIIASGQKVVIFSNWTEVLDKLEDYGITNTLRIDGSVPVKKRHELEQLWQSEPEGGLIEHPVMIGTIDAMGTGLNLNSATNVIFLDEPWTNAKKEQAVDRCHRVGTKDTVNVITLMCHDTKDEQVHEVVLGKKTMSELLIDCGANVTEAELFAELELMMPEDASFNAETEDVPASEINEAIATELQFM